ncbi:MAG: hypothetical protein JXA28_11280 [Bacteroidetes bacterium]|nr:hypothetical protein [Bacteroidota bacterium]
MVTCNHRALWRSLCHHRMPVFLLLILAFTAAACSDSVGPAPVGDFAAQDYTWQSSNVTQSFVRDQAGAHERHTLRFQNGIILDAVENAAGNPILEIPLSYERTQGNALLTGLGSTSVLHVPSTMRFADHITTIQGPTIYAECWLTLDSDVMLAGAGDGGLFRYDIRSNAWYREFTPWNSRITALAIDSSIGGAKLYAATMSDGIFVRGPADSAWSKLGAPQGTVSEIAIDTHGTIFAVIDSRLYVSRGPSWTWELFSIPSLAVEVTGISLLPIGPDESILFIGREKSGLAQVYLLSSHPAQYYLGERLGTEAIVDVRASRLSTYAAVAAADPPMLYLAPAFSGLWVSVPISISTPLTAICQSDRSATVLIGSEHGIYRFDGSPPQLSGLQGKHILSIHYGPDGAFYCGTTSGTFRSADEGQIWTRIDEGSTIVREETGITLFPSTLSVGTNWIAGQLIVQGSGRVELRGRVLEHFDELLLPDDLGRYDDVLVVRYAEELPNGSRVGSTYSWTVYYARNIGPVYIEEHHEGALKATVRLELP